MKRTFINFVGTLALALFALPITLLAQNQPTHKVIMQLDSDRGRDWAIALKRVEALKQGWGDDVQIRLVAHGEGIGIYQGTHNKHAEAIATLQDKGVEFVVCRNSMVNLNMLPEELLPNVEMVQMGAKEIILKQENGWVYYRN